ncbi:MAG: DUF3616 domain-containing protein [Candidatus Competibacteraceae bacterium]|nr:DUF3616 domain-containing protein [Candidatus Competibacteraceae bacterium]
MARRTAVLEFDPELNALHGGKRLTDGLSAAVQIGDALWVTNDETLSLEKLSRLPDSAGRELQFGRHQQFSLADFLQLPLLPDPAATSKPKIEEADLEGLAYHDGYLWLVGSHSLKRKKPDPQATAEKNSNRLTRVTGDGNRFLLARIPWQATTQALARTDEPRSAARLSGNAHGDELTQALAEDEHIGPFLAIPGKDNGFDIEGLAVTDDRLFVGLRGPVLRGWGIILELALQQTEASALSLKPLGSSGRRYRKHFLDLRGLGLRDLCVWGSDLLILAGPPLALAGPFNVFRWPGGIESRGDGPTFNSDLPVVLDLAVSEREQPEGIALFSGAEESAPHLLVVYDSTGPSRRAGENAVKADLFALTGQTAHR